MNRRQFVRGAGATGLALVAGCALPSGAPVATVHRISRLNPILPSVSNSENMAAFREGLRELGYVEGQNLLIDERDVDGDDQFAASAAQVVRLQTELILVSSRQDAQTAQAATTTIPIVSAGAGDLVSGGLAASLSRPGGNVTGLSSPNLAGKQFQLFKDAVPALLRVAVLYGRRGYDMADPVVRAPFEAAGRVLGLDLVLVGADGVDDLESAFETVAREQADGLLVASGSLAVVNQTRIAELAIEGRLPSMWAASDAPQRGGLMGYSPNRPDMYRRAATYVDKILKGAKPGDLPIELPLTFDFAINMETARTLGLTIPPAVLVQATEIIQ